MPLDLNRKNLTNDPYRKDTISSILCNRKHVRDPNLAEELQMKILLNIFFSIRTYLMFDENGEPSNAPTIFFIEIGVQREAMRSHGLATQGSVIKLSGNFLTPNVSVSTVKEVWRGFTMSETLVVRTRPFFFQR